MALLRHEVNITDGVITASTTNNVTLFNQAYSGTVTFYFEIVAKVASGTLTVGLRRNGAGSDDVSITVTQTAFTRLRSAAFTPGANNARYELSLSGGTSPQVNAARIIILQDTGSAGIVSSIRYSEIGNNETGTNITASPLANPKYWTYTPANYDGTLGPFQAAVCSQIANTMGTVTVTLQQDNGSFGGWADLATITSHSFATPQLNSVSFTPTSGRHYRLAVKTSDAMYAWSVFNASIQLRQNEGGFVEIAGTGTRSAQGGTGTVTEGNQATAEEFKVSKATTTTGVKLQLSKTGAPTDVLNIDLVTSLTGSPLASATINGAALTTTMTLYTFTWASTALTAGTTYYIRLTRSGGRDTVNYYNTSSTGAASLYPDGQVQDRSNNIWSVTSGWDNYFELVGTPGLGTLEEEYLLANAPVSTTGLKDYDTQYNPAEWSGLALTAMHEGESVAAGTSDLKLQSDPNGTPTDVAGSTITDCVEVEESSTMTLPGSATDVDVNITSAPNVINASRIFARLVVSAVTMDRWYQPASIPKREPFEMVAY